MTTRFVTISCLLMSTAGLALSAWIFFASPRVGYIDTVRLFNEYRLKIDIEKKEGTRLEGISKAGDSLKTLYNAVLSQSVVDTPKLRALGDQISGLSGQFEEEYGRSNSQINEAVWKRLNPVIDQFSKESDVDLMVGANGMGTVLYGEKNVDYTDKMIKYANEQYKEGR